MAKIYIGTSGYYYDDWKSIFYPEDLKKKDYLGYYSGQFNILELNFTYYRQPDEKQMVKMIEKSGNSLLFAVKASRQLTHEITEQSIKTILPVFLKGIMPLYEKTCLGTILFQFPRSFHYTTKNRIYLNELLNAVQPFPVSIEFRNSDWLKDKVYAGLKNLSAGFVCVDEPDLPGLIPPASIVTSNTGYIRFHGRNKDKWYGTDSTSRYDYLYTEEELRGWLPRIAEISSQTEKLFIFFNNHAKSQAVNNARMLINLLK
ncbi:MAG: DUF72 domain-containing protein [Deltaproteobacteria bacterium]|nr:DUF72 domain-containing protein [Deltaproteobacteria bacterium]